MDTIQQELEAWKQTVHSLDAAFNRRLARVSELDTEKGPRGRLTSSFRRLSKSFNPKAPLLPGDSPSGLQPSNPR
jgi:hypothetical protein